MSPTKLKNYGKTFSEMFRNLPQELEDNVKKISMSIVQEHSNPEKFQEIMAVFGQELASLKQKDLAYFQAKKLLQDNEFMNQQFEGAAFFQSLNKVLGKDLANIIYKKLIEAGIIPLFYHIFPDPEEFVEFDEPLLAFKDWYKAMAEAENKASSHILELVEDNDHSFQMNCLYCARHDIYNLLGVKEAYVPLCYTDDVFFPDYCAKIGLGYQRTGTLVKGSQCCDFRFYEKK